MGPPSPEWDTPHWYRAPSPYGTSQSRMGSAMRPHNPVCVLGQVPHGSTGSRSMTDTDMGPHPGTDPPIPVQVPLQHLHPGTRSPPRYRASHPGTGPVMASPARYVFPRRYRAPIPVRDPHPGTGTVMASPSRQGPPVRGQRSVRVPIPSLVPPPDPAPIPVQDPRPPPGPSPRGAAPRSHPGRPVRVALHLGEDEVPGVDRKSVV